MYTHLPRARQSGSRWRRFQDYPLVSDLYAVLPRALAGPFFYGHYAPDAEGVLQYAFQPVGQRSGTEAVCSAHWPCATVCARVSSHFSLMPQSAKE